MTEAAPQRHLLTIAKTFGNTEQATVQLYFDEQSEVKGLVDSIYEALDSRQEVVEARMRVLEEKLRAQAEADRVQIDEESKKGKRR